MWVLWIFKVLHPVWIFIHLLCTLTYHVWCARQTEGERKREREVVCAMHCIYIRKYKINSITIFFSVVKNILLEFEHWIFQRKKRETSSENRRLRLSRLLSQKIPLGGIKKNIFLDIFLFSIFWKTNLSVSRDQIDWFNDINKMNWCFSMGVFHEKKIIKKEKDTEREIRCFNFYLL